MLNRLKQIIKTKKIKSIEKKTRSLIHSTVMVDENTFFEGYNKIAFGCQLNGSSIGFGTSIGSKCSLYGTKIGRFCSIANGVEIQPFRHPVNFVSTHCMFYRTLNSMPFESSNNLFNESIFVDDRYFVVIGNDVWIGTNVMIKGGVTIGDGAVIGMGSVVTNDVPPYAIVGGIPAKIIRYRFSEHVIESLLSLKWWEWPLEIIEERIDCFVDVDSFLQKFQ